MFDPRYFVRDTTPSVVSTAIIHYMRLLDLGYGKSQVQGSISMNRTEQVLWRLKVPKNYGVDSGGKSWIPCYKRNLIRDVEPLIKLEPLKIHIHGTRKSTESRIKLSMLLPWNLTKPFMRSIRSRRRGSYCRLQHG
ncbi:hypothetical protein YC2023_010418 [Brassica napus]